jgi:hypothetical protein
VASNGEAVVAHGQLKNNAASPWPFRDHHSLTRPGALPQRRMRPFDVVDTLGLLLLLWLLLLLGSAILHDRTGPRWAAVPRCVREMSQLRRAWCVQAPSRRRRHEHGQASRTSGRVLEVQSLNFSLFQLHTEQRTQPNTGASVRAPTAQIETRSCARRRSAVCVRSGMDAKCMAMHHGGDLLRDFVPVRSSASWMTLGRCRCRAAVRGAGAAAAGLGRAPLRRPDRPSNDSLAVTSPA